MRKRILITLITGMLGVVFLLIPSIGAADPKPVAPAHQHLILLPDGTRIPVGPTLCGIANPTDAQKQAFSNFHWNVHKGADGLDNDLGAEIISSGCPD